MLDLWWIPHNNNRIQRLQPNPIYNFEHQDGINYIYQFVDHPLGFNAFFTLEYHDYHDANKEFYRTVFCIWIPTHSFTVTYLTRRYPDHYYDDE